MKNTKERLICAMLLRRARNARRKYRYLMKNSTDVVINSAFGEYCEAQNAADAALRILRDLPR